MKVLKMFKSFRFASNGIYLLFLEENNAKFHLLASFGVLIMSYFFQISSIEWLFVILSIGIVFLSEAINTAIEKICNLIDLNHNVAIGQIKDIAAGAVLITAFISICVALIIFIPKILELL